MKPLLPLGILILSACSQGNSVSAPPTPDFNEARYRNDIKILSSDDFEGRAPTTRGEQLTLDYLATAFKAAGLKGANKGSFLQSVPMVTYTASEEQTIRLGELNLRHRKDIVLGSHHDNHGVDIQSAPLVFVGYGIKAPEYDWDDYANINMKGKIAVILVNDPGFALPDSGKFKGKTMTYYGRWNYKFEEASRQGALGAIIIHDTAPASYPWSVVENSWTGPKQELANLPESKQRIQVEGWMQLDTAKTLFAKSGLNLDTLSKAAAKSAGHTELNQTANIAFANKATYSNSHNLVATLPGTGNADEHIIFTAHWDHLGKDDSRDGDKIFNGALDNASGVAGMLEIARQFAALDAVGHKNRRSLTFIATTGEEQGLLGSRYYVSNPLYPIDKTIAVLNLDATNVNGRTKDFTIVGKGQSQLEDYFINAAKKQGREVVAEKNPASGGFFRSDHFSFAKVGVPAAFAGGGSEPIDDKTAAYKAAMQTKMKGCYHNVCDEYHADWDLSGALEDLALFFDVAHTLANSSEHPGYLPQSEFHQLRPAK